MIYRTTKTDTYPIPSAVSALAALSGKTVSGKPLFYDIETTGLSRNQSFIYLIGAVFYEETHAHWNIVQWLAENESEEALLLQKFLVFSAPFDYLIQFNGNRFDLPFLRARCEKHGIPVPEKTAADRQETSAVFPSKNNTLDLYELLKPCKKLFQLPHMAQKDLEKFLQLSGRNYPDGKKCIQLYLTWQQGHSPALEEAVFGHNREDLLGLGNIYELLSYLALWNGIYQPERAEIEPAAEHAFLRFRLRLPNKLPVSSIAKTDEISLTLTDDTAIFQVKMNGNRLRQYYENYQDYVYLPAEDTAIPKSLGTFLEQSLKKAARPETCYTWFPVTEGFLQSKEKQLQYLRHVLPFYLAHL